jgi:hypothetical protein
MYADWVNPNGTGHGHFKEVDMYNVDSTARRTGEDTHDSSSLGKIDYIFLSSGKWDLGDVDVGDATHSPYSDHDPLWGHATLQTP